jgi:hypothetical protein
MTPQQFIDVLWRDKPEDMFVLIWTAPDKRSHWFRDVSAVGEFVASDACRDKCVFVGIGLSRSDKGPKQRCASEEIAGLCGVWADLDLKTAAHGNKALPTSVEDAISVLPPGMEPTMTVATGNGVHAWWLFKEPLVFDSAEEKNQAIHVVNRWHTLIGLRCAARGWAYDRLSDLARVARVAETTNMKDPEHPRPVRLLAHDDSRRYNLADLKEYLDESAIPDPEQQERAARQWSLNLKDGRLALNLSARIPNQLLEGWMAQDLRFKNTWLRQRHDLRDQSQSGYDLALADFGNIAGLTEQQIVDLIVHHRALHNQKPRHRIEYFQRTISKAAERNTEAPPVAAAPPAPASSEQTPAPESDPAPDRTMSPEHEKAALCERISREFAIGASTGSIIRITRLVKITGKDPSYRMELEDGTKIEFPSIAKFVDQNCVRLAIAAQVNKLMGKIKAREWERLTEAMLAACFEEPGPIEAQWEDAARDTVANYLDENQFIDDIASALPQYRGKPIVILGRVAINTTDFHAWINKTTFQNMSVKALASMLSAMGAEQRRVRVKDRDQSRWLLPTAYFDPAAYQRSEQAAREDGHGSE